MGLRIVETETHNNIPLRGFLRLEDLLRRLIFERQRAFFRRQIWTDRFVYFVVIFLPTPGRVKVSGYGEWRRLQRVRLACPGLPTIFTTENTFLVSGVAYTMYNSIWYSMYLIKMFIGNPSVEISDLPKKKKKNYSTPLDLQ